MTIERVEGTQEAIAAFKQVGKDLESERAAIAVTAGEMLIPDVSKLSRRDTGAMAAGWGVGTDGTVAMFENTQDYWTYQEFGTQDIFPMYAIIRAWQQNEDTVLKAYNDEFEKVAADAGFSQ